MESRYYPMQLLVTLALVLMASLSSYAQTDVNTKYVWAPNGLNLRSIPSTQGDKITKLNFGVAVQIVEETDISYYESSIKKSPNQYESQHPFILKGKWVKVKSQGHEGYIINQYLIPLKPSEREISDWKSTLQLDIKKLDTLEIQNYSGKPLSTMTFYDHGISQSHQTLACGFDQQISLPGFSLNEAFVLFISSLRNDTEKMYVKKYWPEELIILVPGEIETEIKFTVDTSGVQVIHR